MRDLLFCRGIAPVDVSRRDILLSETEVKARLHSSRHSDKESLPLSNVSRTPGKTIQELAREQRAKPFDRQAFAGIIPPGEDIGAFVEEIYRARA